VTASCRWHRAAPGDPQLGAQPRPAEPGHLPQTRLALPGPHGCVADPSCSSAVEGPVPMAPQHPDALRLPDRSAATAHGQRPPRVPGTGTALRHIPRSPMCYVCERNAPPPNDADVPSPRPPPRPPPPRAARGHAPQQRARGTLLPERAVAPCLRCCRSLTQEHQRQKQRLNTSKGCPKVRGEPRPGCAWPEPREGGCSCLGPPTPSRCGASTHTTAAAARAAALPVPRGLRASASGVGPTGAIPPRPALRRPSLASKALRRNSLSLGKQFLLLSEINRERKTFKFLLTATTSLRHTPFPLRK